MLHKIALEEAWSIPESITSYDPSTLAPKGVIGGDLISNLLDVHGTRLTQMDANGIDLMVLSLSSPGAQGVTDPTKAAQLASLANDRLEAEIAQAPTRFAGFAAVSMHQPAQAATELERCMLHKRGFVGVMLNDFQSAGPDANTMLFYDDPRYDVFWAKAASLHAPVYIHPRAATPLIHQHMWSGRPWLEFSALGYANRVNMHVLGIITAGVLDRFPSLKLIIGHMGEHIPFDLYRIDHKLNRARFPQMPMSKSRTVASYFGSQLFLTTSGHFSTPALQFCVSIVGAKACMFSVDYPFESIPNGCAWWDERVEEVVGRGDCVDMGRNNAVEVLGLQERCPGAGRLRVEECLGGGLDTGKGEVEFGLYNGDWERRERRVV
ncbi:MAG: hypothetical protein Q9160_008697 [Pyrenula sp. 1 TL-2023]